MLHIISWSGGKDSTGSIILLHEYEKEILKPGDKVIILFSEVMFDKNISGINPEIINFIYDKKRIFESWGYEVNILRAKKTYLDIFYHKLKRSPIPERIGMTWGFGPCVKGMCSIKRDLKLKPMIDWKKDHIDIDQTEYIGLALDEPKRLRSMHESNPNAMSLLEKYQFIENDAKDLCIKYNMLSPQYSLNDGKQGRDGCWFCPYAKLCEHELIARVHPTAWRKYVSLENEKNLAYPKWNCYTDETLHDRDEQIRCGGHQITIEEFLGGNYETYKRKLG